MLGPDPLFSETCQLLFHLGGSQTSVSSTSMYEVLRLTWITIVALLVTMYRRPCVGFSLVPETALVTIIDTRTTHKHIYICKGSSLRAVRLCRWRDTPEAAHEQTRRSFPRSSSSNLISCHPGIIARPDPSPRQQTSGIYIHRPDAPWPVAGEIYGSRCRQAIYIQSSSDTVSKWAGASASHAQGSVRYDARAIDKTNTAQPSLLDNDTTCTFALPLPSYTLTARPNPRQI